MRHNVLDNVSLSCANARAVDALRQPGFCSIKLLFLNVPHGVGWHKARQGIADK